MNVGQNVAEQDLDNIYNDLKNKRKRVIGWGTGSLYEFLHPKLIVNPEYLVDNNSDKWGKKVRGIEVKKPDDLLGEDPKDIIIVIYSSFLDQIAEQIKSIGEYRFIPASVVHGYEDIEYYLARMHSDMDNVTFKREPKSDRAIVIQGPLINNLNVEIIKYYAYLYPNDHVIVSTWEASSPPLIKEVQTLVDHCLLNTPPVFNGYQNRNYQIVSTLAGLKKAEALGANKVLKVRTDTAVMAEKALDLCDHLLSLYDAGVAQRHGLKNRIIVPEIYTRKYMLYHPADIVMYGHLSDMLMYWDVAHDKRKFSLIDKDWNTKTLHSISVDGGPAESYFGREFCKNIGRSMSDTLQDSWDFYRDFFIVVGNYFLDIFWPKYPRVTSLEFKNTLHRCVTNAFWQLLYFNAVREETSLEQVKINECVWDEFYKPQLKTA